MSEKKNRILRGWVPKRGLNPEPFRRELRERYEEKPMESGWVYYEKKKKKKK